MTLCSLTHLLVVVRKSVDGNFMICSVVDTIFTLPTLSFIIPTHFFENLLNFIFTDVLLGVYLLSQICPFKRDTPI